MMRRFSLIVSLPCLVLRLNGQIALRTSLPDSIPTNSEINFDVFINKGEVSNFAKYQIDVPEGVVVEEVDSRTGTFSYENKRAKIVWVIAPPDMEFVVKMKLISGPLVGPGEIHQKFYYIENGNRKEQEAEVQKVILYKNPIKAERKMISEPKLVDKSKSAQIQKTETNTTEKKSNGGKEEEAVKLQALQFRVDSKKAYDIGSKEKAEAEKNIAEANEEIKRAEAISDETEKKAALEKANLLKEKAQQNNATADKILSLSTALEQDAMELESTGVLREQKSGQTSAAANAGSSFSLSSGTGDGQLNYENKKIDKLSQKEIAELKQQAEQFRKDAKDALEIGLKEKDAAGKKLLETQETIKNAEDIKDETERKNIIAKTEVIQKKAETDMETAEKIIILSKTLEENANEIEKLVEYIQPGTITSSVAVQTQETENPQASVPAPEMTEKKIVEKPIEPESELKIAGLAYMVQIGAFSKTPDKSVFKKLGKYKIVSEDEKFKVLVGNFQTKEEAARKKAELFSLGFDGFIVSYQNGKRVR